MAAVIDERIAERRREVRTDRRRRRLRRTILSALVLAVLAAAAVVERTDLVALQEVRVEGTERLDPAVVREAAALQLGTSTLRLRLGRAEDRIEALPLVLRADARREDALTVTITVTERRPALAVSARGGTVLVDADGQVIDTGRSASLPQVELSGAVPTPGETVADHPGLAAAVTVHRQLPGPLRAEVTRYRVGPAAELTLVLERGIEVVFGDADRIDEKARALGAVLEDIGDAPIRLIDVRAPSTPTVRG